MLAEKRRHKRYKGKDGAFAAFIRPNELINLGQIQNISLGGLCVQYLCTRVHDSDCLGVKIFGSNGRFIHVEKVQCRIVYDYEIPDGSWGQLSTRRCGIEFQNLNVRNLAMLQDFIDHFTCAEPRPESVGKTNFATQ